MRSSRPGVPCCLCAECLFDVKGNAHASKAWLLARALLEGHHGRQIHRLADLCVGAQVHGARADCSWKREAVLRAAHAQWLADPGKGHAVARGLGRSRAIMHDLRHEGPDAVPRCYREAFNMVRQLIPLVQKNYPWLQDTTHFVNASAQPATPGPCCGPYYRRTLKEKSTSTAPVPPSR